MAERSEIYRYIAEVASRVLGEASTTPYVTPIDEAGDWPPFIDDLIKRSDIGVLPEQTRFRFLKRLLLRVNRLAHAQQTEFNKAVIHVLMQVSDERDLKLASVKAGLTSAELAVSELSARVEEAEKMLQSIEDSMSNEQGLGAVQTELATLRTRLDEVARSAKEQLAGGMDAGQIKGLAAQLDLTVAAFYKEFEAKFRGSREKIRARLEAYLPDVTGLDHSAPVLDIGCGRGEWLELMKDNGISAYGVDTNEEFVGLCKEKGLDARLEDATEHIAALPDDSISAITLFHVAEHLDFDQLLRLVDNSLRVLRPGGFILMETPNPLNLIVGSSSFYLDPTHDHPLHPQLLEFVLHNRGFKKVELRYLNPSTDAPFNVPALKGKEWESILRVIEYLNGALFGPLDYAAIGRKSGGDDAG